MSGFAAAMLVGLILDALLGWPTRLYTRIGHPVTWLGRLITGLEQALNSGSHAQRFFGGAVCVIAALAATVGPVIWLQAVLPSGWAGLLLTGALAWPLIAARSMHDHVAAVARPLAADALPEARQAVAMIVGRETETLSSAGVARAGLESLAENTSDGIVAPIFWGVVAGLPGIVAYKTINTLDSMIGYRTERYDAFGKVAARLDDLVNLIPAPLTGLLFAAASRQTWAALGCMAQDGRKHRSPNAGWPEAAMAGALGLRLSGPRVYGDGQMSDDPYVNADKPDPIADDLLRGLQLFVRAMLLLGGVLLGIWLLG